MQIIRTLERIFLVTVFLSMVALFGLSVATREIGGTLASQFAWVEEAVRLMNIFLVFGALGLALERGRHVGVDTLREALPNALKKTLRRSIDFIGFAFSAYMAYLAYQLVVFVLGTGQRSPTLDIPMGWVYLAPVAGFILLSLRYAMSFLSLINRFEIPADDDDIKPQRDTD